MARLYPPRAKSGARFPARAAVQNVPVPKGFGGQVVQPDRSQFGKDTAQFIALFVAQLLFRINSPDTLIAEPRAHQRGCGPIPGTAEPHQSVAIAKFVERLLALGYDPVLLADVRARNRQQRED